MNRLIDVQLAASVWSLRQVVEACRDLDEDRFNRPLGIGPPPQTLQATLAHIIESMFYFADNFAGREYREPAHFAANQSTPDGLISLLDEAARLLRDSIDEFLARVHDDFNAPVYWSGIERDIPAAQAFAQVFDHATHHRVQCVHMLSRLGVDPLPEAYPLEWPGP